MMNKSSKQSTLFQSWGVQNAVPKVQEVHQPKPGDAHHNDVRQAGGSWQAGTTEEGWLDDDDDDTPDDIFLNMPLPDEDTTGLHAGDAKTAPGFDCEAGRLWIYPTNYPVRKYQWSIIQQALFHNTLVVLPTGLGKTFIAAVLMYNFYRWFPQAKIVFMAPTKPLVAQQIDACYNIMGIPTEDTAEMTGAMPPGKRREAWRKCRVFYLTPQVLMNDMSRGACIAGSLRCLVVDEAHKATGNHAYCQVVRELAKHKANFRMLALSATPGSDIKCVQEVVNNLLISHIELRTEQSDDIKPYSHERTIEKVVVDLGEDMKAVKKIYLQIVTIVVDRLKHARVIYKRNVESLSKFMILKSRDEFRQNPPHNMQRSCYGSIEGDFALCISLYHGLQLLQLHGLRSLHSYLSGLLSAQHAGSYTRNQLKSSTDFQELMGMLRDRFQPIKPAVPRTQCAPTQGQPGGTSTFGHPKMEKLQEIVLEHFRTFQSASGDEPCSTRIMIFSQYRDSVSEISEMLNHHRPTVRVISFIGQSSANKNAKGFTQKEQLRVMREFRSGNYNTLVSTCVGEEGLDIGDVDLIICFDAHKSPIRLVQRIGRTGRKRKGRIVMLLTKGKEEQIYNQSQYNKRSIDRAIGNGTKSLVMYAFDQRMVPASLNPKCHKMHITVSEKRQVNGTKPAKTAKKTKTSVTLADKESLANGFLTASESQLWNNRYQVDESTLPKQQPSEMLSLRQEKKTVVQQNKTQCQRPTFALDSSFQWQDKLHTPHRVDHSMQSRHLVELVQFMHFQSATGEVGVTAYEEEMQSYLNPADVQRKHTGMKKYLVSENESFSRKRSRPIESTDAIELIEIQPPQKVRRSNQLPGFSSDEDGADNSDDDLPEGIRYTTATTVTSEASPVSSKPGDNDCWPTTSDAVNCMSTVAAAAAAAAVAKAENSMSGVDCATDDPKIIVEVNRRTSPVSSAEKADAESRSANDTKPSISDTDFADLFPVSESRLVFSPGSRTRVDHLQAIDSTQVRVATPPSDDEVGNLSSAFTSERICQDDILSMIDVWEAERMRAGPTHIQPCIQGNNVLGESANAKRIHRKVSVAKMGSDDIKAKPVTCDVHIDGSANKELSLLSIANNVFGETCKKQVVLDTCGKKAQSGTATIGCDNELAQDIVDDGTSNTSIQQISSHTKDDLGLPIIKDYQAELVVSHIDDRDVDLRSKDAVALHTDKPNTAMGPSTSSTTLQDDVNEKAEFDLEDFQDSLWLDDADEPSYQSAVNCDTPQPVCTVSASVRTTSVLTTAAAAPSILENSLITFSQALACVHLESQAESPFCDGGAGGSGVQQRTSTPMQRPGQCSRSLTNIRRKLHANFQNRSPEQRTCSMVSPTKCLPVSPTFPCSGLNSSTRDGGSRGAGGGIGGHSPTFPSSCSSGLKARRPVSPPLFDESLPPDDKPNFSLGIDVGEEPDFDLGFDMQGSDDNLWSDVEMGDISERLLSGTAAQVHGGEKVRGIVEPDGEDAACSTMIPEKSIQKDHANKTVLTVSHSDTNGSVSISDQELSKLSSIGRSNLAVSKQSLNVQEAPIARRLSIVKAKKCIGWQEEVVHGRSRIKRSSGSNSANSSNSWLCTDTKRQSTALDGNKSSSAASFARPRDIVEDEDDFQDMEASRLTHQVKHKVRWSPKVAKIKFNKKRKKRMNQFIDAEAELSGTSGSEDDEDGSDLDTMDASFVNNATQVSPTQRGVDMRTVYLQSVRSPHQAATARYKLATGRYRDDVFSQVPQEDESNYLEDSFCVADDEVTEEHDDSEASSEKASSSGEEFETTTGSLHHGPLTQQCTTTTDDSVIGVRRRHVARLASSSDDSDTDIHTDGRNHVNHHHQMAPSTACNDRDSVVDDHTGNHPVDRHQNSDQSYSTVCRKTTKDAVSRPSTGSNEKPVTFINSRELNSAQDVVSALRLRHSMLPLVRQLQAADYIVSTRLAVKRILFSEFANRSKKAKLAASVQQLCDMFDRPCLIIETDKAAKQHSINVMHSRPLLKSHLVEKLLGSLVQTHIKVLFSDSQDETANLIADLHQQETKKQTTVSVSSEEMSNSQQHMLNFYLSLPNVNYAMAFRAIASFQTINQFLYSSAETICDRCKMTADQAKRIQRFLQHSFDTQMTPLRGKQTAVGRKNVHK